MARVGGRLRRLEARAAPAGCPGGTTLAFGRVDGPAGPPPGPAPVRPGCGRAPGPAHELILVREQVVGPAGAPGGGDGG